MKMLPVSHKPIETTQFLGLPWRITPSCKFGCILWSGSRDAHLRSNEVKWGHNPFLPFLPISRDRIEIETRKWCQRLGSSSLFGWCAYWPTWVMTWLWPDQRSNFKLTFQSLKSTRFEPTRLGEHDGVIFCIFLIKKLLMKNHLREKR